MVSRNRHKGVFSRPPLRMPRLDTVLMIEEAVNKKTGELTVRALWQKLPKRVMWQTFLAALDYLEYSEKVKIDGEKKVCWTFVPKSEFKSKHIAVMELDGTKPFFNPFFA